MEQPQTVSYDTFAELIDKKGVMQAEIQDKGSDLSEVIFKDGIGEPYKITLPSNDEVLLQLYKQDNADITAWHTTYRFEQYCKIFSITLTILILVKTVYESYARRRFNKDMIKMNQQFDEALLPLGMPDEEDSCIAKPIDSNVTLADVAGCDAEKQEVLEIVDFLNNPEKYEEIGATIPKGVLLVGPPGTGKTLLAKAIAGEANVNFIHASGSEFVEKFVGVGAKRVREIFETAKTMAPCILFIDEIDAVGRQRNGAMGNAEQEQTLNQLLVEMDGMEENRGIVIMAATNRPELLDKAFLRKGRFDRKITIPLPDTKGREEILKVHAQKKKLASDVDLSCVAQKTYGFSGADLYAVLNEAALFAVRSHRSEIEMSDIEEGIDRVLMGHATAKHHSSQERKTVAIHESGHVIVGLMLDSADKIDKVTIVSRGDAGGYAMLSPVEERSLLSKKNLEEKICGLLAGRAAEELLLGADCVTTGAQNDLERATQIARSMVTEYGMSALGLTQWEENHRSYAGGMSERKNYSEHMAQRIDEEVDTIIKSCYLHTNDILEKNKKFLKVLAQELEEKENLTREEILAIQEGLQ